MQWEIDAAYRGLSRWEEQQNREPTAQGIENEEDLEQIEATIKQLTHDFMAQVKASCLPKMQRYKPSKYRSSTQSDGSEEDLKDSLTMALEEYIGATLYQLKDY